LAERGGNKNSIIPSFKVSLRGVFGELFLKTPKKP